MMTILDWPAVRTIYEHGIATGHATLERTPPSWEAWDADHLPGLRWIAEVDGAVVGWCAVALAHRTVAQGVGESSVYVSPAAWRSGIGCALLCTAVRESEAAGLWTLEARVLDGNVASLRLHERHGFRVVGHRERIGRAAGVWRDLLLLERRSAVVGVP
jgi:phosphinothricin acetyltransferase